MPVSSMSPMSMRCPDRAALAAFYLGRLPLPDLAPIAEHLEGCLQCEAVLGEIGETGEDSFVARVTRCLGTPHAPEEDAWAELGSWENSAADSTEVYPRANPPDEPAFGQMVGPYVVMARIGQGGMGVVHEARHTAIGRVAALKMVRAGAFASSEMIARFRKEGTAAARLEHPNVVRLHEFGEHNGLPYYVMELVTGGNLAARLARGPLDFREAAALVRTLAEAIEYAHGMKVLHRDLKPGNVLLDGDGVPKITDFGLAKLLDADTQPLTLSEAVVGTPSYMAPEQTGARAGEIGPATDVYGLGAILYATLTGRPPFQAPGRDEVLAQVRTRKPAPPSRFRPGMPAGLEYVCLKCLEKNPAHRYPSARALADDLERWLSDQQPQGMPGRLRRAARRFRRRAALAACLALLILLAGGVYLAHLRNGVGGGSQTGDPAAELRERLAAAGPGQATELIGETGEPAWSKRLTGGPEPATYLGTDGSFVVDSWPFFLLELASDPQHSRYSLKAQVKHLGSQAQGELAGLYVARQVHGRRRGDLHFFTQVEFNDLHWLSFADVQKDPKMPEFVRRMPPMRPNDPRVRLHPHIHSDERRGRPISRNLAGVDGPSYKPAGEGKTEWHDVELTVTPEGVTARWDGSPPFVLAARDISRSAERELPELRKWLRDDPDVPQYRPTFNPRGGVGIFVNKGSASFRAVTLTPLAPARQDR